jgi:RNA polymerase sigma factor (sigma-70 family)
MISKDKRRIIQELISDLSEREQSIFNLRYLVNKSYKLQKNKHEKEMTLERIGYLKGITRERVRQIINKIIIKLMNNKKNIKYKNIIF